MVAVETDGSAALAVDPEEELAPGAVVGDYEIEKMIGFGGMGIVYGAIHPVIGKRAAIKVLNARSCADHESVRRFVLEAQAVNRIGHTNIVDIFSIGELADGRSYLVMEWLQGETLMDRLEREALSVRETIAILISLTRALEAAHNAGVIHRDLKPENVFLIPEDETLRVKLLDFGIAKLETRRAPTRKTATGMTVGTPLFMSPEQAKGFAIDNRTDIYSLGVLAYAMVCRTTPFEDEGSAVEILHAHISKQPKPPRELVPDLSGALDTLILQMLAKAADERPPITEIRQRLKAIDIGGFETFSTETPVPARRSAPELDVPMRRSRKSIALVLAAIAIGVGVFFLLRGVDEAAPPAAIAPPPSAAPEAPPSPVVSPAVEPVVDPPPATVRVDDKPITKPKSRAKTKIPASKKKKDVDAVVDPFRRKSR